MLSALVLLGATAFPAPGAAAAERTDFVGPTLILTTQADSVAMLRGASWQSLAVRHQEKLLLHGLRMRFWRDHLPADMRRVYEALGYPLGRVLHARVGAAEEWWYYGLLDPPLRFRDGALIDADRFEGYLARFR